MKGYGTIYRSGNIPVLVYDTEKEIYYEEKIGSQNSVQTSKIDMIF